MPNLLYEPRPDGLTAKALSRLWLPLPTAAYRLALKEDTIDEEWEKNSNLAIRDALWEGAFFATPFPGDETFGRDYVPLRGIAAGFALSATSNNAKTIRVLDQHGNAGLIDVGAREGAPRAHVSGVLTRPDEMTKAGGTVIVLMTPDHDPPRNLGSSVSSLKRLRAHNSGLTPNFDPAVLNYRGTTTNATIGVEVIATDDSRATVEVYRDGGLQTNNASISVKLGWNVITIVVTAADRVSRTVYRYEVQRNSTG